MVRSNRLKTGALFIFGIGGFILYAASAPIVDGTLRWAAAHLSIQVASSDLFAKAIQVAGLVLMFRAFGDLVERILGAGEKMRVFASTGVGPSGK
jgi:hypothetical protein